MITEQAPAHTELRDAFIFKQNNLNMNKEKAELNENME